ncbi:hypothetical protein A2U01_0001643 [Trifolium medium]|uniref:Ubiquitin-like domain-containing protein n=1 Tax=Trifolium medium TaxID=97028 RepID=A0A392M0L7_9FABA|nr:hypothetical protein [Trifolium medium]
MSNIQIHVKTGHGKPAITMEVQNTDTIIGIKDKILKEHGIPHDEQHIVFSDSRADSKSDDGWHRRI